MIVLDNFPWIARRRSGGTQAHDAHPGDLPPTLLARGTPVCHFDDNVDPSLSCMNIKHIKEGLVVLCGVKQCLVVRGGQAP